MKRFLAFILTLCMVLSVAPVTFADEAPVATANAFDRDEAEIVKKLGIMPEAILDANAVTRAEFISYIIDILINTENKLPEGQALFNDVDASHEHAGAIYHALKLGLISGSGDGNFNPDSPILWDQAIKILVGALGYGVQAEELGGYPSGYLNIANSRKLTKGIDFVGSNPVLNMDCEILLYRALTSPYVKLTAIGDPTNKYSITGNGTWLTDYMHVKRIEGIVKETGKSSLLRKSNIKSNQIKIDNTLLNDTNVLGQELLGYSVVAFAAADDTNELIYITPAPGMNNVLTIDARDLITDDAEFTMNNGQGCIVYENEQGKRKKVKFGNVDIIYNGVALSGAGIDDLKIKSGSVTLLDNNGGEYSVIIVEEFETYVVHNVTKEEKAIYSKYKHDDQIQKVTLIPSTKDVIFKLVDINKNEIPVENVVPGMILSVYESKDGSFVRIVCSDAFVTGTVTHINNSDNTISVDGEPYNLCTEFTSRLISEIEIGQPYKFWINDRKEIVEIEVQDKVGSGGAYLVKSQLRNGAWAPSLLVKFFTTGSEFITAEVAEKFVLDGKKMTLSECTPTDLAAILNGADSVFEYVLNEEGKITEIDFPYITEDGPGGDDPDSLRTFGSATPIDRKYYASVFVGNDVLFVDNSTVYFAIPADRDNESEYAIKNSASHSRENYATTAYVKGQESIVAKYVVESQKELFAAGNCVVLVGKRSVLNEDGDPAQAVDAYVSGAIKTYIAETTGVFDGFEAGDIVYISLNAKGNVTAVGHIYDRSEDSIVTTSSGVYTVRNGLYGWDGLGAIVGKVHKKMGNYVSLAEAGQEPSDATVMNSKRVFSVAGCPIYVYDSSQPAGKEMSVGDANDILDYQYNGEPSKVVVVDSWYSMKVILIIK